MKNSIRDINYLWIMFVILHVSGATLLMIFYSIPFLYLILLNGMMLLFVIYTARVSHMSIMMHLKIKMINIKELLFAVLVTIFFLAMAEYINAISLLFVSDHTSSVLAEASSNLLMTIITYAIVPAVVEEIMFRGCILRGTSNKVIGLLVSAVTFALLHGNVNQMCYAFFMGLCMGIVALLTENLTVTMIIHALFNIYSIIVSAFEESSLVQFVENIKIGSYAIFAPVLESEKLGIQLVIGLVVFLIAGILVYLVMRLFYKEKCREIFFIDQSERENIWTPDWKFAIGCLVCLLLAWISG